MRRICFFLMTWLITAPAIAGERGNWFGPLQSEPANAARMRESGAVAAEEIKAFDADLAKSDRITYDDWKHRPW